MPRHPATARSSKSRLRHSSTRLIRPRCRAAVVIGSQSHRGLPSFSMCSWPAPVCVVRPTCRSRPGSRKRVGPATGARSRTPRIGASGTRWCVICRCVVPSSSTTGTLRKCSARPRTPRIVTSGARRIDGKYVWRTSVKPGIVALRDARTGATAQLAAGELGRWDVTTAADAPRYEVALRAPIDSGSGGPRTPSVPAPRR